MASGGTAPVSTSVLGSGTYRHETLGVVFQVRRDAELAARLQVLLWQRAQTPDAGRWSLPGGLLQPDADCDASIRQHLATKVDIRQLSHLEQLDTRSDPHRMTGQRTLATAYLGLIPGSAEPELPSDTRWHPVEQLPTLAFDHGSIIAAARNRVRSKLSYTNLGFALAPNTFTLGELASFYAAALGHEVDATNLHRILRRRGQITPTGQRLPSGKSGGRPAAEYRFVDRTLHVTDAFAVLAPPEPMG